MSHHSRHQQERGVSPVVGVILMVAVTVILSATVGMFVMGLTSTSNDPLTAGVSMDKHANNTVTVQLQSLDTAGYVVVTNHMKDWNLTSVGDSVTVPYNKAQKVTVLGAKGDRRTVIQTATIDPKTSVWMESSTCDYVDVDGDGTEDSYCGSTVYLNGTEIFSARGVNVLVLDENGSFVSYAWYDTHNLDRYRAPTYTLNADGSPNMNNQSNCSDCVNSKLVDHLDNISDDHYLLLIGDDQPGRHNDTNSSGINEAVESRYESYGAEFGGNENLSYRDNWLMVTKKSDGKILERWADRGDISNVPYVNASFFYPYADG